MSIKRTLALVLVLASAMLTIHLRNSFAIRESQMSSLTYEINKPAPAIVKVRRPLEPVYGHPMVAGGVHTLAELRVNAWMYPGLDLAHVHEDIVMHSYLAYVSYRYRGITRWTRNRRLIRAGERIWTDGYLVILERCGNVVSGHVPDSVDRLPYEPRDIYPTTEVVTVPTGVEIVQDVPQGLDSPVDTPANAIGSPTTNAIVSGGTNIVPFSVVPIIAPKGSHAPISETHPAPVAIYTTTSPHVVDVPEPPTYLTLSFGIALAYVLCKRYLP